MRVEIKTLVEDKYCNGCPFLTWDFLKTDYGLSSAFCSHYREKIYHQSLIADRLQICIKENN